MKIEHVIVTTRPTPATDKVIHHRLRVGAHGAIMWESRREPDEGGSLWMVEAGYEADGVPIKGAHAESVNFCRV